MRRLPLFRLRIWWSTRTCPVMIQLRQRVHDRGQNIIDDYSIMLLLCVMCKDPPKPLVDLIYSPTQWVLHAFFSEMRYCRSLI